MTADSDQDHAEVRSTTGPGDDPAATARASGGPHGRASSSTDASSAVSLRDEVLAQLTPARRAILAEHAHRIPDDDIVWGIALLLQDLNDDTRADYRRLRTEMAEVADIMQQSRLRIEHELKAATAELRRKVDEVLREHRRRDQTAMERAVARVQQKSMRQIADTHLSDILRVLSGRLLAILGLVALGGGVLGAASFALAAYSLSIAM